MKIRTGSVKHDMDKNYPPLPGYIMQINEYTCIHAGIKAYTPTKTYTATNQHMHSEREREGLPDQLTHEV